jgi:predicted DNA-binding transcriptional regulator YafY
MIIQLKLNYLNIKEWMINMKIDRLLGITIYLLNHKKVTAQVLAERFEVSVRTIMRDINSLCMAGIPVISNYGSDGGYEILNTFKMEKQIAGAVDYSFIVAALKGFATAYHSKELNTTLQKIQSISDGTPSNIILDFGVLSEKEDINHKLSILEQVINERHKILFTYTNSDNIKKQFEVEPIATMYKWYNWYLLCYFPKYKDYRIFKLVRMENIRITNSKNSMLHNVEYAKEQWEKQGDNREYINVKFYCSSDIKEKCMEYLNGTIESGLENGDYIITFSIPENEQFWYVVLLSFGNKIKILEPEKLRQKICKTCHDILQVYEDV